MGSRKRSRKPQQQRLGFEPLAAAADGAASNSSPTTGVGLSPARVTFSSPTKKTQQSSFGKSVAAMTPTRRKGFDRKQQQTLEGTLGVKKVKKTVKQRTAVEDEDDDEEQEDTNILPVSHGNNVEARQRTAPTPPSSFMGTKSKYRRRPVVVDDGDSSETPVEVVDDVTDSDGEGPLKQETQRNRNRIRYSVGSKEAVDLADDSDDDGEKKQVNPQSSQSLPNFAAGEDEPDDQPLATSRSSFRAPVIALDSESDSDDIQMPVKRRRLVQGRRPAADRDEDSDKNDDDDDVQSARKKSTGGKSSSKKRDASPPPSTSKAKRSGVRKRHRTDREKTMEVLRRRKAGQRNFSIEDLTSSDDDEENGGALYDTDSDHEVLQVFPDESDEPEEAPSEAKGKKKKKNKKSTGKRARQASPMDADADSSDADFIDNDDDTMGIPDETLQLMPLEFTRAAIKPLKAHFKDAIEWLIHRRINPAFDRDNQVYNTAWRRLDDEVTGLANSKYISSGWRPEFSRVLKARPYIEQLELAGVHRDVDLENCQACGRSGHPATWVIRFMGKPYNAKTLDEVESDSEDEDDEEETGDRDINGNPIPSEDRQFFVGQTCNSNTGIAHSLIHWKPALRDWVEGHLEGEGWMKPDKVVERERMKARKREKMAQGILDDWEASGILRGLFNEFKANLENARNSDTALKGRRWK